MYKLGVEDVTVSSLDGCDELFLVNTTVYNEDHEFNTCTRGAVWTMDEGKLNLLWPSLGYAKEVVVDRIVESDGCLTCGIEEIRPEFDSSFTFCVEGFVARMGVYKGTKVVMTHSNINGLKFKWGNARLSVIAEELGLPSHEELFGELGDDDITQCVHFMLSYKDTVTGTRHDFAKGAGYITLLGSTSTDRVNKEMIYKPKTIEYDDFEGSLISAPLGVIEPIRLSLEEANDMLKFGFREPYDYTYPELLPGEAVMMTIDGNKLFKLSPPSLKWRNDMRAGDPSVKNRFYQLASDPWKEDDFTSRYFVLDLGSCSNVRDMIKDGPLLRVEALKTGDMKLLSHDHYERARQIYLNFIFSLPPAIQREQVNLYDDYIKAYDRLILYIRQYYHERMIFVNPNTLTKLGTINSKLEYEPGHKYHKGKDNMVYDITELMKDTSHQKFYVLLTKPHFRIDNILGQACRYTNSKLRKGVSDKHYTDMLMRNVRFLLTKEASQSKYQMVKQCDAWVTEETILTSNC
jgi:hypothetical protein